MVKLKIVGIIVFLMILGALFLNYKLSINEENDDNIIYWKPDLKLHTNDFKQTFPFLGDKYSAKIWAYVNFDKDEKGNYIAKAFMDKHKSTFCAGITDTIEVEYLLNHEKYHFNIAAIVAKEANQMIKKQTHENKNISLNFLHKWCYDRLNKLNTKYDSQTNHSLNKEYQYYWEYQIDSLLSNGEYTSSAQSEYGGISCYFPSEPNIEVYVDTFLMREIHCLDKYNMRFRYTIDYDSYDNIESFKDFFISMLSKNGFVDQTLSQTKYNGYDRIISYCSDTIENRKFFDWIIFAPPFKYQLTVNYPLNTPNDTLYERMKNHFFNSVDLSDNDEYWINEFKESDYPVMKRMDITNKKTEDYKTLVTHGISNYSILYHKPIHFKEYLIIPIYPIKNNYNEIENFILFCNGQVYAQDVDSINSIICVNKNDLPDNKMIQFGYTLKSDSIDNVYDLYGTCY